MGPSKINEAYSHESCQTLPTPTVLQAEFTANLAMAGRTGRRNRNMVFTFRQATDQVKTSTASLRLPRSGCGLALPWDGIGMGILGFPQLGRTIQLLRLVKNLGQTMGEAG